MAAKTLVMISQDDLAAYMDRPPTIINDLPLDTATDRQILQDLLVTTYNSSDVLSSVPRCNCGHLTKMYDKGAICPKCNTEVASPVTREIESDLWIAAPTGITALITPLAWIMLSKHVSPKGYNCIEWLCNPAKPWPDADNKRATQIITRLAALGLPRGLNNFYKHFDDYMVPFLKVAVRNQQRVELTEFINTYRDNIFTKHIPLPSKIAFVVENTNVGTYYDKTIDYAIEAAFTAANTSGEKDIRKLQSRCTTVMSLLGKYYLTVLGKPISGKPGWLRRVVYGNRLNFSWRNIITSYHEPHDYGKSLEPYAEVLTMLQPMVIPKLMNEHGMSFKDAHDYVETHATDFDPLLWAVLEQLIDATEPDKFPNPAAEGLPSPLKTIPHPKGGGIGAIKIRYPTLARGSCQYIKIVGLTRAETKFSVLILKAPNADRAS